VQGAGVTLTGTLTGRIVGAGNVTIAASADPWTYVRLLADFSTSGTANANTLLAFTPLANTMYEIEGRFLLQCDVVTTGPRPGISWPGGALQDGAWMVAPSSATAFVSRFWGAPTTFNAANTGLPVINEGFYGQVSALLRMGGSPTGDFTITLASEIAASAVRIMANSFIRYRVVP